MTKIVVQTSGVACAASRRPTGAFGAPITSFRDEADAPAKARPAAVLVRPVATRGEMDEVYRLTHDGYVQRGYCSPRPDGRLVHYRHLDGIPQTTVLVALIDGKVVGTNSITRDGSNGLHVDVDFKEACDRIRCEARPLASSWRIVTDRAYRGQRRLVMELIRATTRAVVRMGVQTCVFTFHPRHERIYQRLLKLRTVARSDSVKGLHHAPAVMMRWDLERCPKCWMSGSG